MGEDHIKSGDSLAISRFGTYVTEYLSGLKKHDDAPSGFDGEVLIVDDSDLHIRGIRDLLKEMFGINAEKIRGSQTRTEALKIASSASSLDSKLLLISDVYTHTDMTAVEFLKRMQALRKRVYITLCTGCVPKALNEMPKLRTSEGLVRMIIDRYGKDVEEFFRATVEDFVSHSWKLQQSEEDYSNPKINPDETNGLLANGSGANSSAEKSPEVNSLDGHTWEEAELFLPEERKAYLSGRVIAQGESLLKSFKKFELSSGDYDLTTDKEGSIEALVHEADRFAANIDKPVSEKLIMGVNMSRDREKRLSAKDVRDLYFCRDTRALFDAMHDFGIEKSQKNVKKIVEELKAHVDHAKNKLQEMGGDSEERLIRVLSEYDIDRHSRWHEELFGEAEMRLFSDALKTLMARFRIPVEEIKIDDRGCGTGRCFRKLIKLLTEGMESEDGSQEFPILVDEQKVRKFILNYHGIDKMPSYAEKTRQVIRETLSDKTAGFDEDHVTVGDFHDLLPMEKARRFPAGAIHFSICMMRTALHNLTQDKFGNFLHGIARDLEPGTADRPGGMALIDTVLMLEDDDVNNPMVQSNLGDLSSLYTQFSISYSDKYKEFMPKDTELRLMRRWPIHDNTTTCGFYWREVISPEYIRYILKKENIDLEPIKTIRKYAKKGEPESKEETIKLGRQWIKDNEFEPKYRNEIQRRIDSGITNPSELLGRTVEENEDVIELLLDYVAHNMVSKFGAAYIVLQRPQKKAA